MRGEDERGMMTDEFGGRRAALSIHHSSFIIPRSPRGITLIELLIVVAIVAVLSAIAIPRFANAIQDSALDQAAKRLAGDLRLAQANAIKLQQQQEVIVDVTGSTYRLVGMTHPDHRGRSYVVAIGNAPYRGVTLTSADFGGSTSLKFDRFGGTTAVTTLVLQLNGRKKTIQVASGSGRITIQ